jgi:DNA-binding IclR family transcriptional regulator
MMTEIQSLARGLKVLQILSTAEAGMGVTDLAAELDVNKGTASRTLQTLAAYGFVEKAPDGRCYQLGPTLVQLSRSVINRMPLRETAKPYLHQLVEATGECAHLAIHAQGQALYIDQVESPATLRVNADVGHMAPLYCTALGKVLLAFGDLPWPEEMDKRTPFTITDPDVLKKELAQIRAQGYAVDDEEYDTGVRCVAVPVFDYRNKIVGAVGVSGPAARVTREALPRIAQQVMRIGQGLSDRLKFKH